MIFILFALCLEHAELLRYARKIVPRCTKQIIRVEHAAKMHLPAFPPPEQLMCLNSMTREIEFFQKKIEDIFQ